MNPADFTLKNLALDTWYKLLLALGIGIFFVSLLFDLKGISTQQAQILSGGLFLFGMGEWINHKKGFYIAHMAVWSFRVTDTFWRPNILGLLLDLIGLVLLYSIFNSLFGYPLYQPILKLTLNNPNP